MNVTSLRYKDAHLVEGKNSSLFISHSAVYHLIRKTVVCSCLHCVRSLPFNAYVLLYVLTGSTLKIVHDDYIAFMCFVWISEQTANLAVCIVNRLVFTTEVENVYCTVRTESLYKEEACRKLKRSEEIYNYKK
jgi:hypothetical protein